MRTLFLFEVYAPPLLSLMEGMKGLILRHHLHLAAIPSTPHVSTPQDTHSVHFPGCGTPTTAAG